MTRPPLNSQGDPATGELAWELDWNLLRTFMVIVEEQSITAAAQRLGLKQPSVSNALKRTEQALGVCLIERGPRRFEITDSGRALYRECAGMFGSVNRLPHMFEKAESEIEGDVELVLASHVVCPMLDDTMAKFHQLHPACCVSIRVSSSRNAIKSVLEKRAALGICLVSEAPPEIRKELFYTEHFGFFCGPEHRLFGKQGLRIEDLRDEHCVSFNTDQLDDVLRPVALLRTASGLDQRIAGTTSNLEEVRRMVIAGLGIGALPIHVVERDVRDGLLFRLPPYDQPPAIDIWTVRHRHPQVNRAEREFMRLLDETIANTPLEQRVYGNE